MKIQVIITSTWATLKQQAGLWTPAFGDDVPDALLLRRSSRITPFSNRNDFAELQDVTTEEVRQCCQRRILASAPQLPLLWGGWEEIWGHIFSPDPAAVLQTSQPLSLGSDDFGTAASCPVCGGGSNGSESKLGEKGKQLKGRERAPRASQVVSLSGLGCHSRELTNPLNGLWAPTALFSGVF